MPTDSDVLRLVCDAVTNEDTGERARGTDGVVVLNRSRMMAEYMRLEEIKYEQIKETLRDALSESGDHSITVVDVCENDIHVWQLPRREAVQYAVDK